MSITTTITWKGVIEAVDKVVSSIDRRPVGVYGVPRGGVTPGVLVAERLGVPLLDAPVEGCLVVDDLVDSGATAERFSEFDFVALFRKPTSPDVGGAIEAAGWLVFPWEQGSDEADGPTDAVRRLLQYLGEDPDRPGLIDTPKRVVKAWREMTDGYAKDPAEVLGRKFPDQCDEMVVVQDIEFTSLCEHHVLPFTGTATVGYLPKDEVVGLSKLARIVDVFAHRLQVQERLTVQIAEAIDAHVSSLGVGVVLRAHHSCMSCRGVRRPSAVMVTSALIGRFKDQPEVRSEFLSLCEH